MSRLFISLYLVIAFTLVAGSTLLERILLEDAAAPPQSQKLLSALLESNAYEQSELTRLLQRQDIQHELIEKNSIAWSNKELEHFAEGESVTLYEGEMSHLYLVQSPQTLLEISLNSAGYSPQNFTLYSLLFFIVLGGAIALWTWPLWRDLSLLKASLESLKSDGTLVPVSISKRSGLVPIAEGVNHLSQRVSSLIRDQKELTGAVAHEFRTPIARLKFALAAQPAKGSDEWVELNNDLEELEMLVQEMLDYTALELQQPELIVADISLQHLVQGLIEKFSKTSHKSISLQGEDILLQADGHFVERAISNLMVNATRYAEHNIRVSLHKQGTHCEVWVEDDGLGIDSSFAEKVFEPFFRPDQGRDRRQGGAGLGLAIVKRIQTWHGGQCYLQKSKLGGACFVLQYPIL